MGTRGHGPILPPPSPPIVRGRPLQDVFTRRVSAVFGGSKERRRGPAARPPVIIDFIAAGELPTFRARERFSTAPVLEMPVHVPDIL